MTRVRRVWFPGHAGLRLAGNLDLPARTEPRAYALYAHCFTCTRNLKAAGYIGRTLSSHGIAMLRFDFAGLGDSEGEFADTSFATNVEDVMSAAQYLASEYRAPALLIGHSLGGAAVLAAAPRIDSCRAVAAIAAPATPAHLARQFDEQRPQIEASGAAEVVIAGRSIRITQRFLQELEATDLHDTLRNLDRALLVLHSPLDTTVGIAHAARIFEAARHPRSFVSLDRADHLLSDPADARYAGNLIAAWASHYLEA